MTFITIIFVLTTFSTSLINCIRAIYNGDETEIQQVPFTVFIKIKPFPESVVKICGGVILDAKTVLTAAHCVNSSEGIQIVAGSANPLTDKNVQRRVPAEIILHPKYDYDSYRNTTLFDFALVKLGTPLSFNRKVQAAKLPRHEDVPIGIMAQVCGWGSKNEEPVVSPTLLCTSAHILNNSYCDVLQKKIHLRPEMICTARSSCQGDSGSGLIHHGTVLGIVSFTLGPCNYAAPPVVHGKVSEILDFIKNNTALINQELMPEYETRCSELGLQQLRRKVASMMTAYDILLGRLNNDYLKTI
ncbi:trypsin 3A1-like [Culicoides brevitarsis]|uniref:trypsin 3A1-like n=1 Tax=Culicoides brevitarsis TaxID=469753 RepID=UPI00307BBD97